MPFPKFPDCLRATDWDAKKGKIAKLAGETGVGAAMKQVDTVTKSINLTKFIVSSQYETEAAVDEAMKECKENFSKLEPLRLAAYKVRDAAKAAAAKYKTNKLIPKASVDHALMVAAAADKYGMELKQYNPTEDFEQARKNVQNKLAVGMKAAKSYASKVEAGLSTLKSKPNPTGAEWGRFWKEDLRGLNAALAVLPPMKPQLPVWRVLCSQQFLGEFNTMPPEEIKKKLAQVETAYAKLKPLLA